METRKIRIIKNKDGHGTINYKLSLPKKWIESMGIIDTVNLDFKDNKIIIYTGERKTGNNFKTDKRLKKMEIELYGNSMYLPFNCLEDYTDVEIENLGSCYYNNYTINGEPQKNTIYKIKDKLYIIDTISHFNTEMTSAVLLPLIEC